MGWYNPFSNRRGENGNTCTRDSTTVNKHVPTQTTHPVGEYISTAATLLTLPPEIRNLIWELLVLRDATILVSSADFTAIEPLRTLPAITQVSQQTRTEALAIFLGRNSFHFDARWIPNQDIKFEAKCFGPLAAQVTSIRHICFKVCSGTTAACSAPAVCWLMREEGWSTPAVVAENASHPGLAGECFAAEHVASHIKRCLDQVMAADGNGSMQYEGLVDVAKVTGAWRW